MKQFLTVAEGVYVVSENMCLEELSIREGAALAAPEGKMVTLTVNGVGEKLVPGTYQGDVRLTLTDEIKVPFFAYPEPMDYRAAVCIDNGYVPGQSVPAAVKAGEITDTEANNVVIVNRDEAFNGFYIRGEGEYVINNADIDLTGLGGNDFNGYGAAVTTHGNSRVTVNNSKIHVRGAARNAFFVGNHSEAHINNCTALTETGVLPHDYKDNVDMGGMMRVPWQLGLRGNNRATNLADYATAYYNNCHLMAEGWGVLSTDAVDCCRLNAKDCLIEIVGPSGYGAFSIGDCMDVFDHCTFNVPDYALIMANENAGGQFVNGTVVNAGRFGVMCFLNQGGELTVKDSTFNVGESAFMIKGCSPVINVENAQLNSESGIILQLIDCDDPTNPGGWYIDPVGPDVKEEGRDLTKSVSGKDVIARFADMELKGDFFNATTALEFDKTGFPPFEMPAMPVPEGEEPPVFEPPVPSALNLELSFDKVQLTGTVSATTAKHYVERVDKTCCEELGHVKHTIAPAVNNGVIVHLNAGSVWNVTGTGYLTALDIAEDAVFNGKLTVNGVDTVPAAGSYVGEIVVSA